MKRPVLFRFFIAATILVILALIFLVSCGNKEENIDYKKYEQKLKELSQKNSPKQDLYFL